MRQISKKRFFSKNINNNIDRLSRLSFSIVRLLMILLSCTYCEENSFQLGLQTARSINTTNSLSDEKVELLINNGAEYTRDKVVHLTLTPSKDADEMLISFSSDCSSGSWEPLETSKLMELATLNQEVSVYVKYRFLGEEETACVGDSIIHDEIDPEVAFVNPPSAWIAASEVSIGVKASDEGGSGVKLIQCDRQGEGQFESCSDNVTYTSLVEGQNYLLVVRAQDKAGNYSLPKQVNWRSDQSPPSLSLSLGPSALTADMTPDFSFLSIDTGSGVSHLECRIDSATRFSSCQNEFSLSNLADGAHSIEVKAIDKVGRSSEPVTHNWTQDTTVPTIHFTDTPPSISKEEVARFVFSGINTRQGIVSYQCQLDSGSMEFCTSPHNLKDLSDGNHVFSVIGSDAVGHNSSPITYRWVVDKSKPTLNLVDKPDKKTQSSDAHFVFQASDAGSGIKEIRCKVDNGQYEVCQDTMDRTNLSEGNHRLLAKSVDRAGNESDELNYEWIVDQTKPTVSIASGPDNPTNKTEASLVFNSEDSSSGVKSTECRLNGGSFEACENPKEYADLVEGDYIFSVRASDEAGNVSGVQTYKWSIDTTGPTIELTQSPPNIAKDRSTRFEFSGVNNEPVSSYECELNGKPQSCTGGSASFTAPEGLHSFMVTGLDALGNKSDPLTYVWVVDATIPTLTLVDKPASVHNSNQATFVFEAGDKQSGVKEIHCKLDEGDYKVCPGTLTKNDLQEGSYNLMAKSIDNAGNESVVVNYSWVVDISASNIRFTETPDAITRVKTDRFGFSEIGGQGDIQSYECELDGNKQACTNPHDLTDLSDGKHVFSVTGLDAVGNRSGTISYNWRVDTTKPTLAIVDKPEAVSNKTNQIRFSFNAQDAGSGIKEIRCKVNGMDYKVCPQAIDVSVPSEGSHTLVAKSIDNAGNESDEVSYQWTVDTSLPTVRITSTPTNPTKEQGALFSFQAGDSGSGIKKIECRLDENPFETCDNTKEYAGLLEGEHQFTVRSEDNAGNLSSEQSYTWLVDITAPGLQFSSTPASTVYIGQTASIQFSASDAGSGVSHYQCSFNGSVYSCSGDSLVSFSATSTRENSFEVKVFDKAGNERTETLTWQTKIEAAAKQIAQEVLGEVPVDILFVVDTSGSMNDERANLADKIDGFIEQIKDLDWQLAATSTDVENTEKNYTEGRLVDFTWNGDHILDSSMDVDEAQDDFGYRIQRISGHNGDEKGIAAAYQTIERYNNNESPHTDFFREGAHLAVVVLSDEEAQGGFRYTPQKFLDFVKTSFTNKTVAWHSIIHTSGDNCNRGEHGTNGTRYEELSKLTNGVVGRICDNDYTSQLTDMGKAVKNLQKEVALGCTPLDDDLDGNIDMEVKFKDSDSSSYQTYSGTYTIQADKQRLIFDEFLEVGDYQFNFKCAKN